MSERAATELPLKAVAAALGVLIAFDVVACCWLGWRAINWYAPAVPPAVLVVIAFVYGYSRRSSEIAGVASWMFAWVALSIGGLVLSYIAGSSDRPLYDAAFKAFDRALGFDWESWSAYWNDHPLDLYILTVGYLSMLPQIVGSVLIFAWRRHDDKNTLLFMNGLIGTLLTILIFAMFPANGPSMSAVPSSPAEAMFLHGLQERNGIAELFALRHGEFTTIDFSHLRGLVSFPSLHTVMAIFLIQIHYRTFLFIPALALNVWMLVSIPLMGGHYIADVVAGACVAVTTLLLTRGWLPRLYDKPTPWAQSDLS